jgi:4-aminobutyrate--pyruvate transaminase
MRLSDRRRTEPLVIVRGEGVRVYDEAGRPYLEAAAGMWCAALGFGEEELVAAAADQMRRLSYYHTLTNKSVGPAIELAEQIAQLVPIDDAQVHFTTSGSEANDYAVKFLRYRSNAIGKPRKKTVIARINGYHGATLAATSLTGLPRYHQLFDLPLPGFRHVGDPHYYRNGAPGESADEFVQRLVDELETAIVAEGPDTVAGFMAEPVTGGGGVVIPPAGYYERIQAVLDRYDVAFLDDEIVTGFGRTGQMFGAQTMGIRPQMMSVGKGLSSGYLPIGAVVMSPEVHAGIEAGSDDVGTFAHGATYSGHPVTCAVALRCLQLIEERRILDHVQSVAPLFARRLDALRAHPLVGDVRHVGLMGAVELVADKQQRSPFDPVGSVSSAVGRAAQERGVIVRVSAAGDVCAFSPPLIVTEADLDEIFDCFEAALDDVTGTL